MDYFNLNKGRFRPQDSLAELSEVLALLDDEALLDRLQEYRPVGRKGYPIRALWYAFVASFKLNLPHTNALIRRLEDEEALRRICGFGDQLPHRTTFNRFIRRLAEHTDLVAEAGVDLINRLRQFLPDLGSEVAVDSTAVRTHSNPRRKQISDPEASWGVKHSPRAKNSSGTEYFFGYKNHEVADVNYGIPLARVITTGRRNDTQELPTVLEVAQQSYDWFGPEVVIADRGYDSARNHHFVNDMGAVPIIHIRQQPHGQKTKEGLTLRQGLYTTEGVPTCMGMVPMEYVETNAEGHHLYRCRQDGCALKDSRKGGIPHCDTEVWQDPREDIRIFGVIRRDGPEWKAYYEKRQAIERIFKSEKESLRLERHCTRGMKMIGLHAQMSALTYQATVLVNLLQGQRETIRWMVRKVA